jgi:hypothetical protein
MTRDRVDDDNFPLTQDFLAQMLGVRRRSVGLAGATLQRAGPIKYSRGRITILNRRGLEEISCECYAFVQAQFENALNGRNRTESTRCSPSEAETRLSAWRFVGDVSSGH